MYKVKLFTELTIKENPQLKESIEDKYYELLIKIAKNNFKNSDKKIYFLNIKSLVNNN